jgi:hypothetical protein
VTGWRFFVVGMLVGGGLVLLGVIVGASLAASRPVGPDGLGPGPDRSGAGTVLPVVPTATATLVPTATPIPIVPCTLASGQGDATVTFTAPAPNGMCQAFLGKQSVVQSRAFALCQASGLNPVSAAACSLVLRRYLSGLSIAPGRTTAGQVSCQGTLGEASYEVRDTGNQYVGHALCWYLAHEAT